MPSNKEFDPGKARQYRIDTARKAPQYQRIRQHLESVLEEILTSPNAVEILKSRGGKTKILNEELENQIREEGLKSTQDDWGDTEGWIIAALKQDLPLIRQEIDLRVMGSYIEKFALYSPGPTYVESPVRQIVERYRKKKYLEDKPAKPFRKKPTMRTKELLGFPPYEERK